MQYTSKIALLAVALFGTSALAFPLAGEAEYDVEAREVDNDLAARESYDMYLEARDDSSLEAREYYEYLEARAREAATPVTEPPQSPPLSPLPQTPMSATPSHEVHELSAEHGPEHSHKHIFLTKHQKTERRLRKIAAKKFKDLDFYHNALIDKENKFHHFAVLKYLSKPQNLEKALENSRSHYHKAAEHILHHRKAKAYLAHKKNFKKALKHKHNKYHKDAVKIYLSHGDHFEIALTHKTAHFHKAAVHEYLLDRKTRLAAIDDEHHPFHKAAVKLQKKINKRHHKHHESVSGGSVSNSTSTYQSA